MKYLYVLLFCLTSVLHARTPLHLSKSIHLNGNEPFLTHEGTGQWDNTLAMNVNYSSIVDLRKQISAHFGKELSFFTGWIKEGEAHITVITPVEFWDALKYKLTMEEINDIAREYKIQDAKLKVMGLGSAKGINQNRSGETFYVIVDSYELREIRHKIYEKFLAKGGHPKAFDPAWFFPHITIGYIERDFHESDGILKDIKHTLDLRFQLNIE